MKASGMFMAVVTAVGLSLTPSSAEAAEASGSILLVTDSTEEADRLAACAVQTRGAEGQGIFGYVLSDVTPGADWALSSGSHYLTPYNQFANAARRGRFAIGFYSVLPTCTEPGRVVGRNKWWVPEWEGTGGTVPQGATAAVVTLLADVPDAYPSCSIVHMRNPLVVDPYCAAAPRWQASIRGPAATFRYLEGVTEPPPPPQPTIRVDDVSGSFSHVGKKAHRVTLSATVVDGSGAPVAGVDVELLLTSPEGDVYPGTATTDSTGTATFSVQQSSGGHGDWRGCVVGVAASGYTYDPNSNAESCTVITVT